MAARLDLAAGDGALSRSPEHKLMSGLGAQEASRTRDGRRRNMLSATNRQTAHACVEDWAVW